MKPRILTVVLCVLLTAAFLLPVAAATAPADPLLATVRTRVAATVGIDTAGAAVGVYRNGEAVSSAIGVQSEEQLLELLGIEQQ